MADVTVAQFAEVLKVPVDKLLSQLDEAGIKVKGSEDTISDDAKLELLTHLRRSHGQSETSVSDAAPRKITLKRKSQSELRLSGAQGRSRTVNVEVRRKRTYIKRDVLEEQAREQREELEAKRASEEEARQEKERAEAEKREAAEEAVQHEVDRIGDLEARGVDRLRDRDEHRARDAAEERRHGVGDDSQIRDVDADRGGQLLVLLQ